MKPGLIGRIARRVGATPDEVTRRQFLKGTLASGGLLLGGRLASADMALSAPRILIVGAGFAGLSCGFQLRNAGAKVTIVEARSRVGGRVLSLSNFVEGRVVEGGAELIGANHHTWMAYAEHFGLEFRDVSDPEDEKAPIILNGRRYQGQELAALWDQIEQALYHLNEDARKVVLEAPWETPGADKLDNTSLAAAFSSWELDDAARHGALTLLANDNAGWPDRASYLATIAAVAGGGYENFWTESEVYRCIGGNQQLAHKLAEAIGPEHIHLHSPVSRIRLKESGVTVQLMDERILEADAVVLTVPPNAWKHIDIEPALDASYRPFGGPAIKYLSKVSRPFWLAHDLEPNALTDTPVGETWDGTDAQRSSDQEPACLTVFSGGQAALDCLEFPAGSRKEKFVDYLEEIYPGYAQHVEANMFMTWPLERWTECGYTSPAVGEVTSIYPKLDRGVEGKLFFAGEYTSLLFTGFMEGGLHSGAKLGQKLATRLRLSAN